MVEPAVKIVLALAMLLLLSQPAMAGSTLAGQEESTLAKIPLEAQQIGTNGTLSLTFNLQAIARCTFGDLNAILLDSYHSGKEKSPLLLTVESLDESAPLDLLGVTTLQSGLQSHRYGAIAKVQVPYTRASHLMGVFICKDSDGDGRCRDKKVSAIDQVIQRYTSNQGTASASTPPDTIYFFQPIVLTPQAVYFPKRGLTTTGTSEIQQLLQERGVRSQVAKSAIAKTWEINKVLGSRTLKPSGGGLRIRLPYFSKSRCT